MTSKLKQSDNKNRWLNKYGSWIGKSRTPKSSKKKSNKEIYHSPSPTLKVLSQKINSNVQQSTSSPVKVLSQTIEVPDSPVALTKSNKRKQLFESFIEDATPKKQKQAQPVESFELTGSQKISQADSPIKCDRPRAIESRCFLRVSKKVEKIITNHNLAKLNESKHKEIKQQEINYELIETIHKKLEERKTWLCLNKEDQIKRKSLFIKLIKVNKPTNGFLDCEFVIDLDRMNELIVFKHSKLKTMLPTHYANQLDISDNALLEYLSPWNVFDDDKLKISYVLNPFWIHILDHGKTEFVRESDEWEIVFTNPNGF